MAWETEVCIFRLRVAFGTKVEDILQFCPNHRVHQSFPAALPEDRGVLGGN